MWQVSEAQEAREAALSALQESLMSLILPHFPSSCCLFGKPRRRARTLSVSVSVSLGGPLESLEAER